MLIFMPDLWYLACFVFGIVCGSVAVRGLSHG